MPSDVPSAGGDVPVVGVVAPAAGAAGGCANLGSRAAAFAAYASMSWCATAVATWSISRSVVMASIFAACCASFRLRCNSLRTAGSHAVAVNTMSLTTGAGAWNRGTCVSQAPSAEQHRGRLNSRHETCARTHRCRHISGRPPRGLRTLSAQQVPAKAYSRRGHKLVGGCIDGAPQLCGWQPAHQSGRTHSTKPPWCAVPPELAETRGQTVGEDVSLVRASRYGAQRLRNTNRTLQHVGGRLRTYKSYCS